MSAELEHNSGWAWARFLCENCLNILKFNLVWSPFFRKTTYKTKSEMSLTLWPWQNSLNVVLPGGGMASTARQICFSVRPAALLTIPSSLVWLFLCQFSLHIGPTVGCHLVHCFPTRCYDCPKKKIHEIKIKLCWLFNMTGQSKDKDLWVDADMSVASRCHPTWRDKVTKTNSELV